jgi:hypothetical protein
MVLECLVFGSPLYLVHFWGPVTNSYVVSTKVVYADTFFVRGLPLSEISKHSGKYYITAGSCQSTLLQIYFLHSNQTGL